MRAGRELEINVSGNKNVTEPVCDARKFLQTKSESNRFRLMDPIEIIVCQRECVVENSESTSAVTGTWLSLCKKATLHRRAWEIYVSSNGSMAEPMYDIYVCALSKTLNL